MTLRPYADTTKPPWNDWKEDGDVLCPFCHTEGLKSEIGWNDATDQCPDCAAEDAGYAREAGAPLTRRMHRPRVIAKGE